jgi:hypothetical protein
MSKIKNEQNLKLNISQHNNTCYIQTQQLPNSAQYSGTYINVSQ